MEESKHKYCGHSSKKLLDQSEQSEIVKLVYIKNIFE